MPLRHIYIYIYIYVYLSIYTSTHMCRYFGPLIFKHRFYPCSSRKATRQYVNVSKQHPEKVVHVGYGPNSVTVG